MAALLFAATVINYIDRQTLSVVAPVLTRELHIDNLTYARILQAFLIAYTVMYLGSGWLTDRWGTRKALTVFMAWWSGANALHALARNAFTLGMYRFLLGIGEPGNFMAANKAVSEWFPVRERAFANGLVNAGAALGAMIATPLVAWMSSHYGWRATFVATGGIALLWIPLWLTIYRRPRVSSASRQQATPWRELLSRRETWGLWWPRFFADPVWWFYLLWLPKFLVEQQRLTLMEMGMVAWLPYLTADIGSLAGGVASGRLIARGWEPVRARRALMVPAALLMPVSIGVAFSSSVTLTLSLICLATFCHMVWRTNLATVTNDLYPVSVLGSVSGILAIGNGLGAALFTEIIGQLVTHFSYGAAFILIGLLHPIALVCFLVLCRGVDSTQTAGQKS